MVAPLFVHLRVHSDNSLIDGLAKIPAIVDKAAEFEMPAIAITDLANLFGLIKFYRYACQRGIKPIIGVDFFLQQVDKNDFVPITLLVCNQQGYKNLTLLMTRAYQHGYGAIGPLLTYSLLAEHAAGLIVLSGGQQGDIGGALLSGKEAELRTMLAFYQQYFADRFYITLSRIGLADEARYIQKAVNFAAIHSLPVVATNFVCFLASDDFDAHEIRVAINDGITLADNKRQSRYTVQQFMRSQQEMVTLFADIPEALANSVEIAKRCNLVLTFGENFLPHFPSGALTNEAFLVMAAQKGLSQRLAQRFPDDNIRIAQQPIYLERLHSELDTINNMGFPGYFLIVMEFIQWAKKNGIPVGPGRGSGAGSLVAYALDITDIDPLTFDLLFERFLNPERVSLPDFDIDFCMERRDRVLEHVTQRYGRDTVAQIITFGTMAAKGVIRDVGRVLGQPYSFVDRIAKLIPFEPGMTLTKAFQVEPQLLQLYDADEEIKAIIDMARKLEGVTRNVGKHGGGVVIAPTKITDFAPLYCDSEGLNPVTQFDKNDVETIGLVKFDFLGLRTLTILDRACSMINTLRLSMNLAPIDLSQLSLDDKKSFVLLRTGETTAVFQLESRGMKALIKRLQPDCFEDMIALMALFRPGPLQSGMVDNFIDRKHGREAISFPDVKWQHDLLRPILEPTYGVTLYQEQVMQIARVMANYSLGEADLLRRAMGKKNPVEMAKQRSLFQAGAEKNGIDGELAIKIFDIVEKFAGYGFNKSHSVAYALISYQTLWLKAHYPAQFMAAVMTSDIDNTDKIVGLVEECRRMQLTILPPDINLSGYAFHVQNETEIIYSLSAIKGVGRESVEAIVAARDSAGNFASLFELCCRVDVKKVSRRALEQIIMAGAFDRMETNRAQLLLLLEPTLKAAEQCAKAKHSGQFDMFGMSTVAVPIISDEQAVLPWSKYQQLTQEREALGFYLSGHPFDCYWREICRYTDGIRLITMKNYADDLNGNKVVTLGGMIQAIKLMQTKRGQRMAVCTLADGTHTIEAILYPDIFEKYNIFLVKDNILILQGEWQIDKVQQRTRFIVMHISDLSEMRAKHVNFLALLLRAEQITATLLQQLSQLLQQHMPGTIPIKIYYQNQQAVATLRCHDEWQVTLTNELLQTLGALVGAEQIEFEFK